MPHSKLLTLFALTLFVPGCGLVRAGKDMTAATVKLMTPRPNDYRDSTGEIDKEWASVGNTANSIRGLEQDNDPLRNLLTTPKARSIERNLGIE
jgi:hypothetical protein